MARHFTDHYLLSLMAQASAAISTEFHRALGEKGISVADWRVLASLYPDRALTIGELCASCIAKQPTMTRMIDRLESNGQVCRDQDATDRRRVAVSLTEKGQSFAAPLIAQAKAHEDHILSGYTAEEAEAMKAFLRLIKRRAEASPSASMT